MDTQYSTTIGSQVTLAFNPFTGGAWVIASKQGFDLMFLAINSGDMPVERWFNTFSTMLNSTQNGGHARGESSSLHAPPTGTQVSCLQGRLSCPYTPRPVDRVFVTLHIAHHAVTVPIVQEINLTPCPAKSEGWRELTLGYLNASFTNIWTTRWQALSSMRDLAGICQPDQSRSATCQPVLSPFLNTTVLTLPNTEIKWRLASYDWVSCSWSLGTSFVSDCVSWYHPVYRSSTVNIDSNVYWSMCTTLSTGRLQVQLCH